ncbi:Response regulator receiver domain-containing protein [Tangfeifania diversioriginum]|uniref:Response regulator receiver domain-containing protein n=1 Tax=Tangfeifania diversioriginum TaxID=1168035 RepID=A0A1M6CKV8_9BACT|nr:response regulator [Tangfeifania diversioriginum]SHI61652.1 Response regulator receiver domain-containing protein [Tangfeifania diversioriginum]
MGDYNQIEILLVEDNPHDAEMALRALKKNNLSNKVLVVTDGEEALDFIFARGKFSGRDKDFNHLPKMILLDLKLPKVNGIEVLKEIKSNPETQVIPVIVLTSSQEDKDIVESYKLGVNSYIVKPVDFDKFVEAVRHLGFYWLLLNKQPQL